MLTIFLPYIKNCAYQLFLGDKCYKKVKAKSKITKNDHSG